jgi:hypothetical protein
MDMVGFDFHKKQIRARKIRIHNHSRLNTKCNGNGLMRGKIGL